MCRLTTAHNCFKTLQSNTMKKLDAKIKLILSKTNFYIKTKHFFNIISFNHVLFLTNRATR